MSGVDLSIHHVKQVIIDAPTTLKMGTRVQDITIEYRDLCDGKWVTCTTELTLFFEDDGQTVTATEEE